MSRNIKGIYGNADDWVNAVFRVGESLLSLIILIAAGVFLMFFSFEAPEVLWRYYSNGDNDGLVIFTGLIFTVPAYLQWHWRKQLYPHLKVT